MMQQQTFRSRNNFSYSALQKMPLTIIYRTLFVVMLLQQMIIIQAAQYKGDSCISKRQPGTCKEWGECPIIKTLIERGEYTSPEVVSCGFGIKEELICCPVIKNDQKTERTNVESTDRFTEPVTTQAPVKDFWLDLLNNTTSSSTVATDFWLDLLKTTTTTTTTTTTIRPLIIGDKKLNESSDFFDFNALLGGKQSTEPKQEHQTNANNFKPNNNPSGQGFIAANDNGPGNLNTRPVSINQWSFDQTGNNFNNDVSNGVPNNFHGNGNGHFGWGQQNNGRGPFNNPQNFNRGHNMERGPHNNNGRGHNNGRGPHNNGRSRNSAWHLNQNRGFTFSENSMTPNNFFSDGAIRNNVFERPVNNMQEQNPNFQFTLTPQINNVNQWNNNEESRIDDLIKNVFKTPSADNYNTSPSLATNKNKEGETSLDEPIANIFNVNKPQNPSSNPSSPSIQPVIWLTPQANNNNLEIEYVEINSPHQQMVLTNPQLPGHFEIIPAVDQEISSNDLNTAPSTNFIQQPVVVETWSSNSAQRPHFNSEQVVYGNLVNSGIGIVKAQENQVGHILAPHPQQQQFGQPPPAHVLMQQQSQFVYQQPLASQIFEEQSSQPLIQQPLQRESAAKEPRSASPLSQFVSQRPSGSIMNVQSPPAHILDPFKPFEFRPPPEDKKAFSEDNNSLSIFSISSTSPVPDIRTDRPAIRACRRIEKGLTASLSPHILGGTPAELGEFPHMAAIGYSRIGGDNRPPYDIRCGGTLIDKRFVLTAAHCVSERENIPAIVRLGVVNFTDANQMKAAVELRIKETYIHDDYSTRLTYNDIAILELERDVEFSEYIYPVCLYTNEKDPDTKIKLWVTGWGTVNTTTRSFSDILLKAPLHTSPLENCNKSFTDYGLNRRIPEGIIRTQFCAEDKDQIKDACQGDSGGPLNLVIDESYKNYRLVGVVSSGFGCASSTPGLYTRVAAFLDFIEKIVWPNGGD